MVFSCDIVMRLEEDGWVFRVMASVLEIVLQSFSLAAGVLSRKIVQTPYWTGRTPNWF